MPLNAQEIISLIHNSYLTGRKNGLENTRLLLEKLELHYDRPMVHVAGTNGKGSVCAMLESVLRCAGYRTGLYTSPFLQAYPERIRMDGIPIADEKIEAYGNPVIEASRQLEQEQDIHATPFEHGTALALSAMQGEQVDVTVVEVGLGGRLDPTNLITPTVCAITAIGMDHMHILGDTIEAIAGEKAGIIKPGVPVVCEAAQMSVAEVFCREAEKKGAPLTQLREDMLRAWECTAYGSIASYQIGETAWERVRLSLPGEHQLQNAMTVLGVVEQLRRQGFVLPDEAVRNGLAKTVWPARLEWQGNILIDGAHNAHGVAALSRFVTNHLADRKRVLLTGVLTEKLSEDMLHGLCTLADKAVTVAPDSRRAMTSEAYAQRLREAGMPSAQPAANLPEALAAAREMAGEDGIIIACGSLYFAGELRNALGLAWR